MYPLRIRIIIIIIENKENLWKLDSFQYFIIVKISNFTFSTYIYLDIETIRNISISHLLQYIKYYFNSNMQFKV